VLKTNQRYWAYSQIIYCTVSYDYLQHFYEQRHFPELGMSDLP